MLSRLQIGGWNRWKVQQAIDKIVNAINTTVLGRTKVTSTDDQADFLDSKIVPGRGLTRTVLSPGAIEQYQIDAIGAEHELIVDPSGDFDDTSIASAITTAIAGGASASDPWLVTVKPGVYTESPMTVPSGVAVVSQANRIDTAFVEAANAGADLFTCTGGYLAGLSLSGVTDASHALIRCATASSLVVMHGISIRGCSTGVHISGGAAAVITNFSISLDGAGQGVTTGIRCEGATSQFNLSGAFFSVPAAILPAYAPANPIQTAISVSESEVIVSSAVMSLHYNTAGSSGIFAENGAIVTTLSAAVSHASYGLHIGPNGANTTIVLQGARMESNLFNGYVESATGALLVSASTKEMKFSAVAGSKISGLVQVTTDQKTIIAGDTSYRYSSSKEVDLGDMFHDISTSGVTYGGEVTDDGGLDVNVAAGEGYSSRHAPEHDTEDVQWDADTITLTDDATNYVIYDPISDSITSLVAAPGSDKVLLSIVVTLSGDIIYLHDTRQDIHQPTQSLHDYLLSTRRIAWISGLATSQGTANANLDVDAGSWYRAWEVLPVAGGSDITWAYYYGSGGGLTRVAGVTAVDVLQYDNAGVLTAIPVNRYKADTLIVTSDNRFTMIYGTETFATPAEAEDTANKASIPNFLDPTGCHVALIVSQRTNGVGSVTARIDIRPNPNAATAGGGGGAAPTDHAGLTGLAADDHLQYLRTDGTRPLTGSQGFGGNNITSVGTVNGVTVEGHQARHRTGGPDALPVATAVLDGLMSAADKIAFDALVSSYAEIYLSTPTTQAGLSGTPTTLTTFNSNGVSADSTADQANSQVTIGTDGNYQINFGLAFSGSNNATYTFQVTVDGTPQTNGVVYRKMGVGGDIGACGFACLLSLTAGQQITIDVSSTGTSLTAQSCVLDVVKV